MKSILIFLLWLFPFISIAQQGLAFYSRYNQSAYTYLGDEIQYLSKNDYKTTILNITFGFKTQIYRDNNFAIHLGISYKFTDLTFKDVVDSVNYYYTSSGNHNDLKFNTYHFDKDKPDYHNLSNSLGLNLDYEYYFGKHKNNNIGIELNYYCFEFFKGFYKSDELQTIRRQNENNIEDGYNPIQYTFNPIYLAEQVYLPRNFFSSAVDLQLYYQYTLNFSKNFSLGFRASIGTNLYSDWNQFKKYVWVGFGVNFGFLSNEKVRLNKKMPLGEVEKKESM